MARISYFFFVRHLLFYRSNIFLLEMNRIRFCLEHPPAFLVDLFMLVSIFAFNGRSKHWMMRVTVHARSSWQM